MALSIVWVGVVTTSPTVCQGFYEGDWKVVGSERSTSEVEGSWAGFSP